MCWLLKKMPARSRFGMAAVRVDGYSWRGVLAWWGDLPKGGRGEGA